MFKKKYSSLKLIGVFAGIFLSFSLNTPEVHACSCFVNGTAKELESSDAVFLGEVIEEKAVLPDPSKTKKPEEGKSHPPTHYEYTMKVEKSWKGVSGSTMTIGAGGGLGTCSYHRRLEPGQRLLIYADMRKSFYPILKPMLFLNNCSRTKTLDKGEIEAQYLDAIIANKDTKTIIRSLLDILTNEEMKNENRIEALDLIIETIRDKPDDLHEGTVRALVEATESSNTKIKIATIDAFSYPTRIFIGKTVIKKTLLQLLNDKDQTVRNAAAQALGDVANNRFLSREFVVNDPANIIAGENIFGTLVQEFEKVALKNWENKKLHERTISILGVSISKVAGSEEEKIKAAEILSRLMDRITDPHRRASIMKQLGYLGKYGIIAAPKLMQILKNTNDNSVKKNILSMLGNIKATKYLEDIKPFIKDKNCSVVQGAILAVHRIDSKNFPEFLKNNAMQEIKKRFDDCAFEILFVVTILGSDATAMKPFIIEKLKTMDDHSWQKSTLEYAVEALR